MLSNMPAPLNDIDHMLTKPKHPWTNGQVERMNRTIKDATVKRYFYESHDQLRSHLRDFVSAYVSLRCRPPGTGDAAQAMSGLLTLADVDRRDSRFTPEQLDALTAAAPHQIGPWVVTLNEWRLANCDPTQDLETPRSSFSTPASKVGRNDPCPCGSGKKYKKCCGLN